MSRTPHDSPYRDDPSPQVAPPRSSSSRPARKPDRPRQHDHQRKPHSRARAGAQSNAAAGGERAGGGHAAANGKRGKHAPRVAHPTQPAHPARAAHPPKTLGETRAREKRHPVATSSAAAPAAPPARRRSRRRGRGGGSGPPQIHLTSHPTGRAAYADTRAWLLEQHGAICAYCAREFTPQVMTLDHVAPRRGQTAYDRRDNLVLACRACNEAKRDLSPLAYLLAVRSRAANLLRYGTHLSPGLLDLARSLMPKGHAAHATSNGGNGNGAHAPREKFSIPDDDGESPYRD